jgi:hypothetical protein
MYRLYYHHIMSRHTPSGIDNQLIQYHDAPLLTVTYLDLVKPRE